MSGSELFRIADTLSLDSDSVALSARQGKFLNDRLTALSLQGVSDGIMPLGSIVAVMGVFSGPNNTGAFTLPTALPLSGEISTNGLQLCDGKLVNDRADSQFRNKYVPNLTSDIFLKGSVQSGSVSTINGPNNGNNRVTLTTLELPSHAHQINLTLSTLPTTTYSIANTSMGQAGNHTHTWSNTHGHGWENAAHWGTANGAIWGGNDIFVRGGNGFGRVYDSYISGTTSDISATHSHSFSADVTVPSHSHTFTVKEILNTGNGASFSIEPKYVTVSYYMRVR